MKKILTSLLLVLVACSSSTSTSAHSVSVAQQWARTSPMDATMGAVYFTIDSPSGDTLTGVKVAPGVAATAEMHETVMNNGAMKMQPVASVDLPAGKSVKFAPGGLHVMLLQLATPLKVGTALELTLVLQKAGEVTVSAPVLDQAP
jgi:copper(I)-binding protein